VPEPTARVDVVGKSPVGTRVKKLLLCYWGVNFRARTPAVPRGEREKTETIDHCPNKHKQDFYYYNISPPQIPKVPKRDKIEK